jgi:Ca2+-transporting ATPase
MSKAWHSQSVDTVLEELDTDPVGLTKDEASLRLEKYGPNELQETKRVTALQIFLNQFTDVFVIMLLIATLISFVVGEIPDALTIAAIVVLNAIVGFVQEYRSEKAMEAMRKLAAPKARLMRNGQEVQVPAKNVVPGDIVLLEAGDRIPADGRVIEAVELRTNEAVLTGESTQVDKRIDAVKEKAPVADRKNMVFTATHVTYGRGKAVVTSTGMTTEFGKIAEMVQTVEQEDTPLKLKLESFAKTLGMIIVIACAAIFILEVLDPARPGTLIESFITAVALAVSAVPEGLPAVVTISLALGARELARRNAIIRRLASAETLGATTVICSDKTGTLTKGEMTVREVFTNDKTLEVTGVGYEAEGQFLVNGSTVGPRQDPDLRLLLEGSVLCTNASYDGKNILGDTTEGALIVAAAKAGVTKKELEEKYPRVHEIPFTSERKRMTTIHRKSEGTLLAFMKGAPEVVLARSTKIFSNGQPKELTNGEKQNVLKKNEQMASNALRVLGVAFKELPGIDPDDFRELSEEEKLREAVETDLVFIGLAGMIDPPRDEAKEANKLCQQAGIKTIMITGDHKLTAKAVAKEIGLIKSDAVERTLTGGELDALTDPEFEKIVEDVRVYARVAPEHKMRIVKALRKKGEVVAMTGDGVNDAPALKQADIGVAMGITGTDVTKEAADMVLADDNFATIVNAVEGGRAIYDNIRKFSFFLLRSNFDELVVIGSFALLGLQLPLSAGMILWINLVTDGAPAVALTKDPPEEGIMKRPPRNPKEGILHGRLASILVTFATQFVGTAILFYVAYYILHEPLEEAMTLAFMQATFQELVIVWNCRSEDKNAFRVGFTSNKYLLYAVIFSFLITAIIPYTGVLLGLPLFDTTVMTISDWLLITPFALSGFLILPEVFYNRKVFKWR